MTNPIRVTRCYDCPFCRKDSTFGDPMECTISSAKVYPEPTIGRGPIMPVDCPLRSGPVTVEANLLPWPTPG